MSLSHRYYRVEGIWATPSKRPVTDYEQELLNEIELLRIELDTLNEKLARLLSRADL